MRASEEERVGGARTMDWIGSCAWLAGEESLILILDGPARGPLIVTSRFGEFLSMNLRYNTTILTEIVGFRYYYWAFCFIYFLSVRTDWTDINRRINDHGSG